MSIAGLILARGGSKGICHKNLRQINGETLVFRTASEAKKSKLDKVFVYSDDDNILLEGEKAGAISVKRPALVSGDTITSEDTIVAFMQQVALLESIDIMMLQCTTPFMKSKYIDEAVDKFTDKAGRFDSVISVTECNRYLGYISKGNWIPLFPYRWLRQEHGSVFYMENGGFYLTKHIIWKQRKRIALKCGVVVMPWWESVEIDEIEDLEVSRAIASIRKEGCCNASHSTEEKWEVQGC